MYTKGRHGISQVAFAVAVAVGLLHDRRCLVSWVGWLVVVCFISERRVVTVPSLSIFLRAAAC
jgi:hypothetical protein